MIRIEDHCCSCAVPGYPCMGAKCPNRRVEVHYCDECEAEIPEDEIYVDENGLELCESCVGELEEVCDDD